MILSFHFVTNVTLSTRNLNLQESFPSLDLVSYQNHRNNSKNKILLLYTLVSFFTPFLAPFCNYMYISVHRKLIFLKGNYIAVIDVISATVFAMLV